MKLQAKCLPIQARQAVIKECIGKIIELKGNPLSRRMEDEDRPICPTLVPRVYDRL